MKRIISVFLLSGILISITCCTKEAVREPQTVALSPQEAYMLLAKHIKSTEDDVIYLDMTAEQSGRLGIEENAYKDALDQIGKLNQSIRQSKEKGITVVNGLKTKNQITKGGFPDGPGGGGNDGPGQTPLYYEQHFGPYIMEKNTELTPGPTEDDFAQAMIRATYVGYHSYPSSDDIEPPFPYLFNIYVYCYNGGETYQLINSASQPVVYTYDFHGGRFAETYRPWKFSIYNASSSPDFGCPVEITVILINDSRPQ